MEDRVASFAIMAVARRRVSAEQWFSGGHASLFITIIRSYVLGMCDVRCAMCDVWIVDTLATAGRL